LQEGEGQTLQADKIVQYTQFSLVVIVAAASLTAHAPQSALAGGTDTAPIKQHSSQTTTNKSASAFASGVVRGQPFQTSEVCYDRSRLIFKSAPMTQTANLAGAIPITHSDAFVGIGLNFATAEVFAGEYFVSAKTNLLTIGKQTQPRPQLMRYTVQDLALSAWQNDARYSMSLKFFKKVKGMLPGYIDLTVTDGKEQTRVKGFFYAVEKPLAL
jgi:hypothetical protein